MINDGRLPRNAHEVVLGAKTMRTLHTRIGAVITGTVDDKRGAAHGRRPHDVPGVRQRARRRHRPRDRRARDDGTVPNTQRRRGSGDHFNYMLLRFAPGTAEKSERKLRAFLATQGL